MSAILALMPDWLKLPLAALLGALVVSPGIYLYGNHQGRQQAAVAALEASVTVLRQRNKIDEEISAADAARLCTDLGLSDDEAAECVRRLATPDAEP
jgi:hypothetical protein